MLCRIAVGLPSNKLSTISIAAFSRRRSWFDKTAKVVEKIEIISFWLRHIRASSRPHAVHYGSPDRRGAYRDTLFDAG
jgi:hypothetical protein